MLNYDLDYITDDEDNKCVIECKITKKEDKITKTCLSSEDFAK